MKKKIINLLSLVFPFLSVEKNRGKWVQFQLEKIPIGESILDAGAGEMPYKKFCTHLKYTSQDFGKYDGKGDIKGLQTDKFNTLGINVISDITAIPVPSDSFDNVLCTEVLEHVPYPDQAIKELARILKKDGKLFLTAPFCSMTHFSPYHFCTGFNRYWYEEIFKANGLDIFSIETNEITLIVYVRS
jgi:ubiquinone/menaquinone biosynthesis C-methylase UbiE